MNVGVLSVITGATLLYAGIAAKDSPQVLVAWVTTVSLLMSTEARSAALKAQAASEQALKISMERS